MMKKYPGNIRCYDIFAAIRQVTLAAVMLSVAMPLAAVISTGTDAETGLPYWEVVEHGVSIRLVQRLPDQTRGFFQARGFSIADAELIAQSCVFQTVFKNVAPPSDPGVIEYNLDEWIVHVAGAQRRMKTREDWQKEWSARNAPKAAQLAFEWGLIPTRQTYRPGDYNWGMSLFSLVPGTSFDLDVVWRQGGERHAARMKRVVCAPDVHVSPDTP